MRIRNVITVICIVVLSLNLFACGRTATEEEQGNVVENTNEEYQEIIQIDCYENYDPSVDTSSLAPRSGNYDG